ncbi:LysR family transcriptional regulator [Acinetobacter junii]|uniref:LysR substrate-binding domain-containing protein n=1 Tax=Acinetobacter junii TaxID=40215 RepID=UPI00403E25A4
MDQLKAMKSFVCIIEQGSLSKAAEILNSSPSSVARLLASLEATLEIRLVNRTTRSISLTEEGSEYLAWCKHILHEVELMNTSLDARKNSISGELNISAPIEFGNLFIAPLVNSYLKEHPTVSIQLNLSDQLEDIVQNNFDLVIRIGNLPDSSLIATRIGYTRLVYCASKSFLDQNNIKYPADLKDKKIILISSFRDMWSFIDKDNKVFTCNKPLLSTDQVSVARQACIDGLGVGCFYYYQVSSDIKSKKLSIILDDYNSDLIPIHFLYPHVKLISPRVKHFMNWIKNRLMEFSFH